MKKRKGLNLRNKIVRGVTYTSIFISESIFVFLIISTTIDKLFY